MNILLISLLGCLVVALPSASAQKVKWCLKSQNELKKCQYLSTKAPELECHVMPSLTECMTSIKNGDLDAITVDGQHIYQAGLLPYDLRPVIADKFKTRYCYAVVVVKKDTDFTINDLKGKTSCHSCYLHPGGWNIPIGRLVAQNKIPWDGPDDIALEKAVSRFFSSSCVPGISKALYPNLCQACQGDCSCSQNENYYGDEGALQCLKKGHGQVAFVCQDAVPWSESQNYQLLCMDGSRKNVEDYKDCYLAKEPHRAVISRKDADSQHIYKVLQQIPDSDLFSSAAFGGKDVMFLDSTCELVELPKSMDSFMYLGENYYEAMHALRAGNPSAPPQDRPIEWCTISHAEHQKCDLLSSKIPRMVCVRESSVEECFKKIMHRKADAIAVDASYVYIAGKCGLVPVMVEQYNQESCDDGGGKGPDWANDLKSDEFELICPQLPGKTVKHNEFPKCNLARVPAHAVITREDARADVVTVLKQPQANSEVQLFKSGDYRNLLFTDSTKCLQENNKPLVDFLTQKYIDMIEMTYKTDQGKPDLLKACTFE